MTLLPTWLAVITGRRIPSSYTATPVCRGLTSKLFRAIATVEALPGITSMSSTKLGPMGRTRHEREQGERKGRNNRPT